MRSVREGSGAVAFLMGVAVLFGAVWKLQLHDYLASVLLVVVGLGLVRAGVELLRPSVGE